MLHFTCGSNCGFMQMETFMRDCKKGYVLRNISNSKNSQGKAYFICPESQVNNQKFVLFSNNLVVSRKDNSSDFLILW